MSIDTRVVTKRRRRPVDPCLGYYKASDERRTRSSRRAQQRKETNGEHDSSDLGPVITSPTSGSADSPMMTVDAFLHQQLSKSSNSKRSGRQIDRSVKRRRVITSSDTVPDVLEPAKDAPGGAYIGNDHLSSSPWTSPIPILPNKSSGKKLKSTGRNAQLQKRTYDNAKQPPIPFSERIRRAAALSHVKQASLTDEDWSPTLVIPLKMVSHPTSTLTPPPSRSLNRHASLVSATKRREYVSAFETPSKPSPVKRHRPLTQLTPWNSMYHSLGDITSASALDSPTLHGRRACSSLGNPLHMISYEEHCSLVTSKYPNMKINSARVSKKLCLEPSSPTEAYLADFSSPTRIGSTTLQSSDPSDIPANITHSRISSTEPTLIPSASLRCTQPNFDPVGSEDDAMNKKAGARSQDVPMRRPLRALTSMLDDLRKTAREVARTQTHTQFPLDYVERDVRTSPRSMAYSSDISRSALRSKKARASVSSPIHLGRVDTLPSRCPDDDSDKNFVSQKRANAKRTISEMRPLPSMLSFLKGEQPLITDAKGSDRECSDTTFAAQTLAHFPFGAQTFTSLTPSCPHPVQSMSSSLTGQCRLASTSLSASCLQATQQDDKASELLSRLRVGSTSHFGDAQIVLESNSS